jgi:hypothetical protein
MSAQSAELVKLGQEALAAVANGVAVGAPLAKCQLLASEFYEVLRNELRKSSRTDEARRSTLAAALDQCDRATIGGTSTAAMLQELGSVVDLLQADVPPHEAPRARLRPILRVIEGGLSKI